MTKFLLLKLLPLAVAVLIGCVNCARREVVVTYLPAQDKDGTLFAEEETEE